MYEKEPEITDEERELLRLLDEDKDTPSLPPDFERNVLDKLGFDSTQLGQYRKSPESLGTATLPKERQEYINSKIPFLPILVAQLERLDTAIAHEYDLIESRLTWFMVSEAFILVAFTIACTNYASSYAMKPALMAIIILMPLLGIVRALLVSRAIFAARSAAQVRFKPHRQRLEEMLQKIEPESAVFLIGSRDQETQLGDTPAYYLPKIATAAWGLLFIAAIVGFVLPM
jgi:hypothetical protein